MRRAAALGALLLVLLAPPAAAENPVLDAEGDADVADALAEATELQQVCYGYELSVSDQDTGRWQGTYAASSLGAGVLASSSFSSACREGVVELVVSITYTSQYSEAEDRVGWSLASSLPELDIGDVEDLGLSARDLLDDGRSETTLLNAVLALPRLASEQAGLPPVVAEPNTTPLPADAAPTGTPGSDWLRENGLLLAFCVLLVLAGLVLLALSFRTVRAAGSRAARSGSGVAAGSFFDL